MVTEWLKSNDKLAAVGDKVTDKDYFGTGLGIAVRQGNTELQQKFNAALEKVKKDTDRNFWMSPAEALDYGIVGKLITHYDELNLD